ncbi:UNVERIFIED_CONTAM: GDSL esterase/lipase [Sesamum radiatum]|uniref:GDSL esterase/lipase n=1 Tax=Sesamum radiatum TaxID=300843 RepID=A0AAW2T272_SESRA
MFVMIMKTMSVIVTAIFLAIPLCLIYAEAIDYNQLRLMAAKHNMTCILVFGDSTVDPGNNNYLFTPVKSNFLPYGEDLYSGHPTGRFCNGRLTTDFIAEAFGFTDLVRAFLDPAITSKDMLHGVSFASAATGYDEFTANLSNVLSISKQLDYFRQYKNHIKNLVGTKESEEIVKNALVILSMGTNDFLLNYYVEPTRSRQYNIEQYQNYLISCMKTAIKENSSGRNPPFGCVPIVRTLRDAIKCDDELNEAALSFNSKIQRELKTLAGPSLTSVFVDIYGVVLDAFESPERYGFTEALKGCCGSGAYEYGITCKHMSTCSDRTKYVFWDAIHPTERMYKILADGALELILSYMF